MPFELTTYEAYDFANRRHIGPSPTEMEEMLKLIGFDNLDALIDATVPPTTTPFLTFNTLAMTTRGRFK